MHLISALLTVLSVLSPTRTWYPPTQPLTVDIKAEGDASLVLTDFDGKSINPTGSAAVSGAATVDLKKVWPQLGQAGTFILFVQPKGKPLTEFEGTPLVIEVRAERGREGPADPQVIWVGPLEYAAMTTNQGAMTMAFYYDVAPVTVASFLDLSRTGYYNGLNFHRVVPDFVIQGGDPKGDGTGGPGYHVPAEFSARPHVEGALSMARAQDPNSGGSQFFICLDYSHTKSLDGQYTVFGRVIDGLDTVKKIAASSPGGDGPPKTPQIIEKVEVKPVTAKEDPYAVLLHLGEQAK